jgi:hypothetical protein
MNAVWKILGPEVPRPGNLGDGDSRIRAHNLSVLQGDVGWIGLK